MICKYCGEKTEIVSVEDCGNCEGHGYVKNEETGTYDFCIMCGGNGWIKS